MTVSRCKTLLDFFISRFSRIFPAYWTGMLLTTFFLNLIHSPRSSSLLQVLVGFTMTEKLFGINHVDGSYWTLNVELSFYFWITLIFLFGWIPKIERVIVGLLSFQLLVALYNRFTDHMFSQGIKVAFLLEYCHLFCAGMIFYLIWHERRITPGRVMLLLWCLLNERVVPLRSFGWIPDTRVGIFVVAVIFTVMLLVIYGKMKWLVNPPLLFLGGISYCFYLVHSEIGQGTMAYLIGLGWPSLFAFWIALTLIFSLAILLSFLIERPARDAIRTRYKDYLKRRHTAETAPSHR